MSGADALAAAFVLATAGSASYSTSISSSASSALAHVSAATIATGSPTYRTLSIAPAYSAIGTRSPAAYRPGLNGLVSRFTSAGATTPFTPGSCAAASPCTDAMRAWGVRAPQNARVQHPWPREVIHEIPAAGHVPRRLLATYTASYVCVLLHYVSRLAACFTASTICTYPVHIHRLLERSCRISSSVGSGFRLRSA